MQLTVQMSGLKELEAALKDLEKKLATKIARRAVAKGAGLIRNEARTRAKAQGLVNSGALARNIALKRETKTARTRTEYHVGVRHGNTAKNAKKLQVVRKGKLRTLYSNDPFYWWFWEFGHQNILTRKREQKPFLRPAYEAKREAAAQMIADTLRTELLKAR
jgi:HK97 gp10 family phage protein